MARFPPLCPLLFHPAPTQLCGLDQDWTKYFNWCCPELLRGHTCTLWVSPRGRLPECQCGIVIALGHAASLIAQGWAIIRPLGRMWGLAACPRSGGALGRRGEAGAASPQRRPESTVPWQRLKGPKALAAAMVAARTPQALWNPQALGGSCSLCPSLLAGLLVPDQFPQSPNTSGYSDCCKMGS